MATLTTWLASQGASLLLGWLAQFLLSAWDKYTANKNTSDLAAANATVASQQATIDAQQAELQAQADAPKSAADAISRLREGSA
ncbi:hypothetical protein [Bradyrhizobium sp. SYSU BS000235]|uniref:hypothetical protein n=1 Tax=Bradyrhizobium sp. SYSU BS000235 TaxID=3411332 RepID=UPI003C76E7B1